MDAFKKAREAQKRAEEERIKAEREIRQHATQKLLSAKSREREGFNAIVQRLGTMRLRVAGKPMTILDSKDRSERKIASDETPSIIHYGEATAARGGGLLFNVLIQLRFDPAMGLLRITLGHESSVSGAKVAPKGLMQEWNDVDSLMNALIQWALNVPEIEAY
jgi:hypothetical protein